MTVAIPNAVSLIASATDKPAAPPTQTQVALRQMQADLSEAHGRLAAARKADAGTIGPDDHGSTGKPPEKEPAQVRPPGPTRVDIVT